MHTFQGSDVVFESLQNAQIWRLAPCLVTLKTVSPRAVIEHLGAASLESGRERSLGQWISDMWKRLLIESRPV